MFSGLRLRLTLLYTAAALALLALVGGGAYLIVARYFAGVTDLALQHKMAHEFHALAAPLPAALAPADRDWSLLREELDLLPQLPAQPDDEHEEEAAEAEHAYPADLSAASLADSAELAAIFVLPLDASGRVLFRPIAASPALQPDRAALELALATGSDLRTVAAGDGRMVRLLTYRLTRDDGPAALQLGRELGDQESVLNQLLAGLLGLGTLSMLLVGGASWWLAGRSLRPAQESWERQQRFVASASHELRTPLTLIRASAEVALRAGPADPEQRELLGDVIGEADHMHRLVDDLLTLSRLDSGQLPLNCEAVELAPLLADLQRQAARLGAQRDINVVAGPASGRVRADVERLRQVLLILIDNALRYTPPGGQISLAAEPEAGKIRLRVSDTGPGIAPEHLPLVFERFYRADPARSGGNAGLGLSIAQSLIIAMGGQIRIESTPGQGTSATISLEKDEG